MAEDTKSTQGSDNKQVHKALQEMTLGELKGFVQEHGEQIGVEVVRSETFNTKYTAMPRTQIISSTDESSS